ncbi:MAG: hypothetical protein WCI65_07495 [Synechococcaceae cyanobacterium ELA263]
MNAEAIGLNGIKAKAISAKANSPKPQFTKPKLPTALATKTEILAINKPPTIIRNTKKSGPVSPAALQSMQLLRMVNQYQTEVQKAKVTRPTHRSSLASDIKVARDSMTKPPLTFSKTLLGDIQFSLAAVRITSTQLN